MSTNPPSFQTTQPVTPNRMLAMTRLVLGILGWTVLPTLGGVIAIITGHMAKNEIRQSGGQLAGDGMATAGLILGYTSVLLSLCVCVAILFFPALLSGLWFFGDQLILTPTP